MSANKMGLHDDSSNASSDFFSPISISFFHRPQPAKSSSVERLPPLAHDKSWIGARLSPIGSFDREEHSEDDAEHNDEEQQNANKENRRRKSGGSLTAAAPHQQHPRAGETKNNHRISESNHYYTSSTTLSTLPFVMANEETRLLGNRTNNIITLTRSQGSNNSTSQFHNGSKTTLSNNSKIHPLWNSPPTSTNIDAPIGSASVLSSSLRQRLIQYCTLGMFLSLISGGHLLAMGIYDLWGWYHNAERETIWTLPWGIPPRTTLLRFGALAPNNDYFANANEDPLYVYYFYRYLGVATSLLVCTSSAEWVLVAGAWRLLHVSSRLRRRKRQQRPTSSTSWYEFGAVFVASAWTGQLWIYAFDATDHLVTGTVALGTCGVLCAVGMARPLHRFELFVLATLFVFLALFQRPFGSVWATTGSAFLGWALSAAGLTEQPSIRSSTGMNENDRHGLSFITFLGTGFSLLILIFPVFSLAFQGY